MLIVTELLRLSFIILVVVLAVADYCTMLLPDKFTIPLLGIGLVNASLAGMHGLMLSVLSALIVGGFFLIITIVYPRGMGMGDTKFVAALASFLGFQSVFLAVLIACLTAAIMGGAILISRNDKLTHQIPFGPYLGFGALMALFWGNKLLSLYWTYVLVGK